MHQICLNLFWHAVFREHGKCKQHFRYATLKTPLHNTAFFVIMPLRFRCSIRERMAANLFVLHNKFNYLHELTKQQRLGGQMVKQLFLNGADLQLERISKMGDPLEKINGTIDWEMFRPALLKRTERKIIRKVAGHPLTWCECSKLSCCRTGTTYLTRVQST